MFIKGLKLSEAFYREAAQPILEAHFPQVRYSAALIGWGSEVLGYDDAQSTDHHWGPRFLLFLSDEDFRQYGKPISTHSAQSFHIASSAFQPASVPQMRRASVCRKRTTPVRSST